GTERDVEEKPAEEAEEQDREHQGRGRLPPEGLRLVELVQVDQHDDEEEQHHDAAAVDEGLDQGQELGVPQQEEHGDREEGEEERDRPVHRILERHHPQRADHREGGEEIEEQGGAVRNQGGDR